MPSLLRASELIAVALTFAVAAAGCASPRGANPFAASGKPPSRTSTASKERSRVAGKKKADSGEKAAPVVVDRGLEAPPPRAGRGEGAARDAGTTDLIERELADATADEREAMLTALRDLPDESVRQVLRARRMGMRYNATSEGAAGESPPAVIHAAAEQNALAPAEGPRPGHSATGVGTISAWSPPVTRQGAVPGGESGVPETADAAIFPGARGAAASSGGATQAGAGAHESPVLSAAGRAKAAAAAGVAKAGSLLGNLMPGQYSPGQPGVRETAPSTITTAGATVAAGQPREMADGSASPVVPASADAQGASSEHLTRLIAATEAQVLNLSPGDTEVSKRVFIEKHVQLRMMYLMSGQQERALQAIPLIDPADQEFWQQTFWGLSNYFDAQSIPSSADRAAQTVAQLTSAVLRLQEKANLELRNVNLCHKISSFGNYEKYPRDEFSPGQEVLLYAEVANIHSDTMADGKFRTSLKSVLEIYRHGPQGELIERIELPETVDICRAHRRDYFHSYQFTIPAKLTMGPHVLKLSVEDQLSRRVATYSVNFMVK